MTDLRALTDAFAELERRADAASQAAEAVTEPPARRPSLTSRLVPVAATVAVVAGLAAGVVWLVPGDNSGTRTGGQPTSTSTTVPTTSSAPAGAPETPDELIERFRTVLGDTATFEVTERGPGAAVMTVPDAPTGEGTVESDDTPPEQVGASIVGTLTAAGVTGGFDLVVYPSPIVEVECECTQTTLPDGSLLITSSMDLESDGTTHSVELYRSDGVHFIMHVSNESSPKGNGETLAAQPPLTIDQMVAIITSDRW